ncbi:MAG: putative DNA modification/repair radical SAM protein [Actinobacteria bacterium]|nr:putative DNA modification/repair radical SAM protein [Actinomycetota bacterium]
MDLEEKLRILGAAARYDVTCSSAGSARMRWERDDTSASLPGIYYSRSDDGRCVPLLKVLFSNRCVYDCAYCVNRASARRRRASFTPREVAALAMHYYRRRLVRGLFLSSGVWVSPDHTMERLVLTAKILRWEEGFRGYIHLKVIPGSSPELIREAGLLADRLSVNIELPSEGSLRFLAPDKKREDILRPMGEVSRLVEADREERRASPRAAPLVRAGQTTQLIVGATPESDLEIITLAEGLYREYGLRRIYYSAFVPVSEDPRLPPLLEPPLLREHRLYQADWLLRRYGFTARELVDEEHPDLDGDLDPKSAWALRNLHYFPVEVNRASYEELLRVPGIGTKSARRIVAARRVHSLDLAALSKLGVACRRARYFVTCNGRYYSPRFGEEDIRRHIRACFDPGEGGDGRGGQISLFKDCETRRPRVVPGGTLPHGGDGERAGSLLSPEDALTSASGEL